MIAENIKIIKNRISEACKRVGRDPSEITLIAVSKTKPLELIHEAIQCNQYHFGENRMQELQHKMGEIDNPIVEWHMIGTIQTNKIKYISERVNWIHSVPKAKYLSEINKRAAQADRTINVLIQVNISHEKQKSGCDESEVASILEAAKRYEHIKVRGLMGMARFTDNPEDVRSEFALLKTVFENHIHQNGGNVQLTELSMGMSNDFEVAIEEGATMIRVGSSIFGLRN